MTTKPKKLLTLFLIALIMLSGIAIPKKTNAIFGVVDVVIDPVQIGTSITAWIQDWSRWLIDQALKTLAATLRKRLIDNITRRIVNMIQGNGEPRFVDNFSGLFEETFDQAVGETAQQIGLGDLCSSQLRMRLRIQINEVSFQDRVSCTLDDIVDNIEGFGENFRNGSWLAYNEVLKPANNRLGLRILVEDELLRTQNIERESAQQDAEAGGGFLSQKRCLQWQQKTDPTVQEQQLATAPVSGESYYYESPDQISYHGTDYPAGSDWFCAESETVTPGSTLRDAISKGVTADIDFLNNASDDIAGAISTIANAAINQLVEKGIGLIGIGRESEGGTPIGEGGGDCGSFEGAAQDACEDFNDQRDDAQEEAESGQEDLASRSEEVQRSSAKSQVLTYEKCPGYAQDVAPNFGNLRDQVEQQCKDRMLASGPYVEVGTAHILSANELHQHTGAFAFSVAAPQQILLNYRWSWESCPEGAGQCPQLAQASGDLASDEANIPGPAYTPTQSGLYKLKLTVRDTGGESTEMILEEKTMILSAGEVHDIETGASHTHTGAYVSDVSGQLQSYDWSLESCPGQCPTITKSGVFQGGNGGDIEGPTFTPQEPGDYVLRLNVRDVNGSVTSQTVTDVATGTSTSSGQ